MYRKPYNIRACHGNRNLNNCFDINSSHVQFLGQRQIVQSLNVKKQESEEFWDFSYLMMMMKKKQRLAKLWNEERNTKLSKQKRWYLLKPPLLAMHSFHFILHGVLLTCHSMTFDPSDGCLVQEIRKQLGEVRFDHTHVLDEEYWRQKIFNTEDAIPPKTVDCGSSVKKKNMAAHWDENQKN